MTNSLVNGLILIDPFFELRTTATNACKFDSSCVFELYIYIYYTVCFYIYIYIYILYGMLIY